MTVARSPWDVAADIIDPQPSPYLQDPVSWVKDKLNEDLWSKQREIMEALLRYRRVAVKAAHDVSKSHSASRLACWVLDVHPVGDAFVVTTAPTHRQVHAVLWREIGKAHRLGQLAGRVTMKDEWYMGPGFSNQLVGFGAKPADYDPAAFQGFHELNPLVIVDEAGGVPRAIFDGVDAIASNENAMVLAIGNPDDPESHFAEICKPGSGYHVITISAYDSPAFTGEPVSDRLLQLLVSKHWVEERKRIWGENSAIFISKVLGEFPESASDGVVPWKWASRCQYVEPDEDGPIDLGLDVGASTGGDATVIRERRGNKPGREWILHTDDSEEIVGTAVQAIQETGAKRIKIDIIGVGFGVAGHLRALRKQGAHDCRVFEVNVSNRSSEPKRFPNLRSQIWWEVGREASQQEQWSLADLDDQTIGELLAPKYKTNATGQTVVEPKAETKKRLDGRSPDRADALLLAFYEPVNTGKGRTMGKQIAEARIG